jgi:sulfite dehydrogenase (cytochrome) subunit B
MKEFAGMLLCVLLVMAGIVHAQGSHQEGTIHSITLPVVDVELKPGEGRDKVVTLCNICHSLDYIIMQPKGSRTQWTATVNKMIKVMGAPINESDAKVIIDYLTAAYGTGN